ncbi:MAG: hypothetical protein WAS21_27465 [Geminicoccaceae bacterium]
MDDKDKFSVWLADTILQANGDAFGAAALGALAEESERTGNFDDALREAGSNTRRPGDFGVEFVGPLLPVLLVEFGRLLWDAYSKALVEQGGKALASLTIEKIKELVKATFGHRQSVLSITDAEAQLRKAGQASGLNDEQVSKLLEKLRNPEAVRALAG